MDTRAMSCSTLTTYQETDTRINIKGLHFKWSAALFSWGLKVVYRNVFTNAFKQFLQFIDYVHLDA